MPRTELAQTQLCLKRDRDDWINFNAPSLKKQADLEGKRDNKNPLEWGDFFVYSIFTLIQEVSLNMFVLQYIFYLCCGFLYYVYFINLLKAEIKLK